jgi:hypothetical protein
MLFESGVMCVDRPSEVMDSNLSLEYWREFGPIVLGVRSCDDSKNRGSLTRRGC